MYSLSVIEHFERPRNTRVASRAASDVVVGAAGSVDAGRTVCPECERSPTDGSRDCASKRTGVLIASPQARG